MDFLSALDKEIAQVQEKMAELQSRHDTLVELRKKYVSSPGDTKPPIVSQKGINKSGWLRKVILEKSASGITPAAIIARMKDQGVPIQPNYLYALLAKFRKRGLINVQDGRYFPYMTHKGGNQAPNSTEAETPDKS